MTARALHPPKSCDFGYELFCNVGVQSRERWKATLEVDLPGQPILGLPSSPGRIGSVVIGGLNPIAILEEMNFRVYSRALSGLLDYSRMFSYQELPSALSRFLNRSPA